MSNKILPNTKFLKGLNLLLGVLVENYLNTSYCGCLISRGDGIGSFRVPDLSVLTIRYEEASFAENLLGCIESGCSTFFVMADVFQEFHNIFLPTHDRAQQRVAEKYVLVISAEAKLPRYRLDLVVIQEIPNLLFLSNKDSNTIGLYGIQTGFDLELKDSFDIDTGNFLFNYDLFPSLAYHLNGRSIRVAAIIYLPNAYFRTASPGEGQAYNFSNPDDEKSVFVDGTESRVILELCHKFNCTITMHFVDGMWGGVDENMNGTGILGSLAHHETDIGYAAMYQWASFVKFLSISSPLSKNEVTCMVPRPKLRPYYLTPILPFPPICWLGLLLSFVVLLLSLKVMTTVYGSMDPMNKKDASWSRSVFTVIAVFLVQSYSFGNERLSKVVIFFVMLVIGIVLDNIYSGGLAAVLTIPHYEKPIDTSQELADSPIPWAGNTDVWIFSIVSTTEPTTLRLLNQYEDLELDELLRRSTAGDLAIVAERAQFGHVATVYIHLEGARALQLMHDNIYWEYIVMYTPKTFPFLNVLNILILQIAQSGIQSYWELEVFTDFVDPDIQRTILHAKDKQEAVLVKLQLRHFLGAYIVLGVGCFTATVVFMIEIMVDRKRRRTNIQSII